MRRAAERGYFRKIPQQYYALRLSYQESRRFLVDSGASFHLISYKDLTKEEKRTIRPTGIIKEMHSFFVPISIEGVVCR